MRPEASTNAIIQALHRKAESMLKEMTRLLIIAIALLGFSTAVCWADDYDEILGYWESYDSDSDEVYRIEFGEDGFFYASVYDYELGYYIVDLEAQEIGFFEEDEEEDEAFWMPYELEDDILTLVDGDEVVQFFWMYGPEEPENEIVGYWMMMLPEEDLEDMEAPLIYINFRGDGTGIMEELSEEFMGAFAIDPELGTMELTMDDEGEEDTKVGEYEFIDGLLVISIDGEEKIFDRIF
jgi:hypothetical protein